MTQEEREIISESLQNYFKMNRGTIWTKPDIHSALEELHFEDLDDWVVRNSVESLVFLGLKRTFKTLNVKADSATFKLNRKTGTLEMAIAVSIKELDTLEKSEIFNVPIITGEKGLEHV